MKSFLTQAKNARRAARRALAKYEKNKSKENLNALFATMQTADAIYNALSAMNEGDARLYRKWALATAPDVARQFGLKPALEIVR